MPPIQEPATAPWDLSISDADFEKLKAGFTPEFMEDRWLITATNQSPDDSISVTISRSWTHNEFYIIHAKPRSGSSSAKISAITWEQKQGETGHFSEEEGKEDAVDLMRCILDCDLEEVDEILAML